MSGSIVRATADVETADVDLADKVAADIDVVAAHSRCPSNGRDRRIIVWHLLPRVSWFSRDSNHKSGRRPAAAAHSHHVRVRRAGSRRSQK